MKCLSCGSLLMDHGCPCAAEQGASGQLDPDAGNPSTGEGFGSPRAPLHSVAECEMDGCPDCADFWRDEMADSREGEE